MQKRDSFENFKTKIKAKYKKEKFERKDTTRSLREINYVPMVESSPEPNDDERAQQKDKEKAKKWWAKQNRYYFKEFDRDDLDNYIEFTTSFQITEYGCQISYLFPYYQSVLQAQYPAIFPDYGLRILYRRHQMLAKKADYALLCYYCPFQPRDPEQEQVLKEEWEALLQEKQTDSSISMHSFHPKNQLISIDNYSRQELEDLVDESLLLVNGVCYDKEFIEKALRYEAIWRNNDLTEVEKQEECWLQELEEQHAVNMQRWRDIQNQIQTEAQLYPSQQNVDEEIQKLKKALVRGEIYVYFRDGFQDKNQYEFEKAMDYLCENNEEDEDVKQVNKDNQDIPKFIETDCKICFCTKNQANNRVIYCDDCNTSFHFGCYGISKPIQPQEPFLCDVCSYTVETVQKISKAEKLNSTQIEKMKAQIQKPSCQICGFCMFPRKKLGNHFYHVTCLVLFNFADVKDFQIKLKPNVTHQSILSHVIQKELENQSCEYCLKNGTQGLKHRCNNSLCSKSYHSLCAYLCGCKFSISWDSRGMKVQVECREHFQQKKEEMLQQVYVRRFFTNFKNTYKMSMEEFTELYQKEEIRCIEKHNIDQAQRQKGETGIRKILNKPKRLLAQLQKSQKDRRKKEPAVTETSAILKEIQKKISEGENKNLSN